MNNLGLAEIQCVLNSSELEEPVDGHVVEAVGIKMAKVHLCACVRGEKKNGISHDGGREAYHDTVKAQRVHLVLQSLLHLVDGGHPESQIQGQSWLSKYFSFVPQKPQISHVDSVGLRTEKSS